MTETAAPTVTFYGAAHTVTGSMHLLEAGRFRVLLDCGLYQGRRDEARIRNSRFPFDPASLDAVILSHAHMDHCGNLPNLVKQGYSGPIYSTSATRDLAAVMLADSAKIQEEDAAYLNRQKDRRGPRVEPLYAREHVHRTMRQFQPVRYDRPFDLGHGIGLLLVDAGHLLGSAMVHLTLGEHTLTFTGDLGRRHLPILRDPALVPPAGLLITESTYGGETHPPADLLAPKLGEIVRRTVERGGTLLIPAFSLGRTQTVVYFLHQLMQAQQLPDVPIFVDSPLAANATEVFRLHPECFDEETAELLEDDPDLFGGRRVQYIRSVDESKRLNARREPSVIIAASGMCESGRILHHLKHRLGDERNTVLLVGFQAPETLGRRLAEHAPEVRIHDRIWPVRAEVVMMHGFSGHADQADFRAYLGPLADKVCKVRLVHGEPDRAEALARDLRDWGFRDVAVPVPGDSVTLP